MADDDLCSVMKFKREKNTNDNVVLSIYLLLSNFFFSLSSSNLKLWNEECNLSATQQLQRLRTCQIKMSLAFDLDVVWIFSLHSPHALITSYSIYLSLTRTHQKNILNCYVDDGARSTLVDYYVCDDAVHSSILTPLMMRLSFSSMSRSLTLLCRCRSSHILKTFKNLSVFVAIILSFFFFVHFYRVQPSNDKFIHPIQTSLSLFLFCHSHLTWFVCAWFFFYFRFSFVGCGKAINVYASSYLVCGAKAKIILMKFTLAIKASPR